MAQPTQAQTFGVQVLPSFAPSGYRNELQALPLDLSNYFSLVGLDQRQQGLDQNMIQLDQNQQRIDLTREDFELRKADWFNDITSTNTSLQWANGQTKDSKGNPNYVGQNQAQLDAIAGLNEQDQQYQEEMGVAMSSNDFLKVSRLAKEASQKTSLDPRLAKLFNDQNAMLDLIEKDKKNPGMYDPLVLNEILMNYYGDEKGDADAEYIRSRLNDPLSMSGDYAYAKLQADPGFQELMDKQTLSQVVEAEGYVFDQISDVELPMEQLRLRLSQLVESNPALVKKIYGDNWNAIVDGQMFRDTPEGEAVVEQFIYNSGLASQEVQLAGIDVKDAEGNIIAKKLPTNHEKLDMTLENATERMESEAEIKTKMVKDAAEIKNEFAKEEIKDTRTTAQKNYDGKQAQIRTLYDKGEIGLEEAFTASRRVQKEYLGTNPLPTMKAMESFQPGAGRFIKNPKVMERQYLEDFLHNNPTVGGNEGNVGKKTIATISPNGSLITNHPQLLAEAGIMNPADSWFNNDLSDIEGEEGANPYISKSLPEEKYGKVFEIPGTIKYDEEAMYDQLKAMSPETVTTLNTAATTLATTPVKNMPMPTSFVEVSHVHLNNPANHKAVTDGVNAFYKFGKNSGSGPGEYVTTEGLKNGAMAVLTGFMENPEFKGLILESGYRSVEDYGKNAGSHASGFSMDIGLGGSTGGDPDHPNIKLKEWLRDEPNGEYYLWGKGYEVLEEQLEESFVNPVYSTGKPKAEGPHLHFQRFQPKTITIERGGETQDINVSLHDWEFEKNKPVVYEIEGMLDSNGDPMLFTPTEIYYISKGVSKKSE